MEGPALRLGAICVVLLVASSSIAAGAAMVQQDTLVSPSAIVPITLVAGSTGSTTLGASATAAATTHAGSIVTAQQVLKVHKVSGDWDVTLTLSSATGFGALDSATIKETLGATTQTHAIVALGGTITQNTGLPITVTSSGTDPSITVVGTKVSAGSSVLTMTFTILPAGATTPALTYNYVLTLT